MDWSSIGTWLKQNATGGAALIGSLLTGNIPGAVAAGVGLIGSATGSTEPMKALQALQTDPATMAKLQELANANEASIRQHIERMETMRLQDEQANQKEQQETIRSGDNASDAYISHTRPMIVRQSWYTGCAYLAVTEILSRLAGAAIALSKIDVIDPATAAKIPQVAGADVMLLLTIWSPVLAYFGFRSIFDKGGLLSMFGKGK